jgi:hypothetical protein
VLIVEKKTIKNYNLAETGDISSVGDGDLRRLFNLKDSLVPTSVSSGMYNSGVKKSGGILRGIKISQLQS